MNRYLTLSIFVATFILFSFNKYYNNIQDHEYELDVNMSIKTLGNKRRIRKFPFAIVIGVKKCGTSALVEMLGKLTKSSETLGRLLPPKLAKSLQTDHTFKRIHYTDLHFGNKRIKVKISGKGSTLMNSKYRFCDEH